VMPIEDPGHGSNPQQPNRRNWPHDHNDPHSLGRAFADPNALDDQKLAHAFIESNSSAKHRHHLLPHLPKKPASTRVLRLFLLAVALVLLIVFLIGYLPRHRRTQEIDQRAQDQRNALPVVEVLAVQRSSSTDGLTIPGTTTPFLQANIYARSNGYVTRRLADIGDHVHKDQLLAIIDSPDLDQQVDQARQQLRQAVAQKQQQDTQLALTKVTVERWRVLVAKGVFSRQDGDQTETNYQAQIANVAAAQRNVEAYQSNLGHLVALQQFERITAPFTGIVTARNFDVGALVAASGAANSAGAGSPQGQSTGSAPAITNSAGTTGSAPTAATPSTGGAQGGALFSIVDDHRLRILASVPEGYAAAIARGQHATVRFQEFPQTTFHGEVTRTADSIDQNTRTLLVEVQVDNRDGKLMDGMYAVVTFDALGSSGAGSGTGAGTGSSAASGTILIPGDAVVIRRDKSVVAVITPANNSASGNADSPHRQQTGTVHFQPVEIGRDYGASMEILNGLREGDLIAVDVTDDVTDGARVQTQTTPTTSGSKP
jgi:multidrug efflux pump subunit AcrA (membrane-fusion protein)